MMQAHEIAAALGGKRSGRQFVACCPAHEDARPSLLIFDGHSAVQFRCLAGCDPREVMSALKSRGILEYQAYETASLRENFRSPEKKTEAQTLVSHETIRRHQTLAADIWRAATDASATLAHLYLASRNLSLPEEHHEVMRYHPACPRGDVRQPALVVLMREVESDQPVAIQRIFLSKRATKDGAQMLGPVGGAAMKISSKRATFTGEMGWCERLHVCEGLETGLALYRDGVRPVWALGSAGAMRALPVIFGVGAIVCCADHDEAGLAAAEACVARWGEAGRDAEWRAPEADGADYADVA